MPGTSGNQSVASIPGHCARGCKVTSAPCSLARPAPWLKGQGTRLELSLTRSAQARLSLFCVLFKESAQAFWPLQPTFSSEWWYRYLVKNKGVWGALQIGWLVVHLRPHSHTLFQITI